MAGWGRRKEHEIDGTTEGAKTDFQLVIWVHKGAGADGDDDIYCGGNCRDDFGDIRFTEDDGITPMKYNMEQVESGVQAKFRFKMPAIPADPASKSMYVYYDKADETDDSDPANVYLWYNPCTSVAGWVRTRGAGTIAVVGTHIFFDIDANDTYWEHPDLPDGLGECKIRYRIYSHAPIAFYNGIGKGTGTAGRRQSALMDVGNGGYYDNDELTGGDALGWTDTTWHEWECTFKEGANGCKIYLDDVFKSDCNIVSLPNDGTHFKFHIVWADMSVDEICVMQFCDPEPSHGIWGGEETP
ncbi:hypothetical protein ES705_48347 [subsurface metagenome]